MITHALLMRLVLIFDLLKEDHPEEREKFLYMLYKSESTFTDIFLSELNKITGLNFDVTSNVSESTSDYINELLKIRYEKLDATQESKE